MADQNMHENPQQRELLRVCRIGRAQGMKGEVTVQVFTDEPEWRFEPGSELFSRDGRAAVCGGTLPNIQESLDHQTRRL